MSSANSSSTPDPRGLAAALVAVVSWGLGSVITKDITMGGLAVAAYRFAIYGVGAAIVRQLFGHRLRWGALWTALPGGIALGVDVALFFSAVKLTSVANATVIGSLQPLVVALLAWRVFGERVERRNVFYGAVAIAATAVVVLGGSAMAPSDPTGDALAVGALFAWAAYFFLSKQAQQTISSAEYTLGASLWAGIINIPLALAFGQSLAVPTGRDVWLLVALVLGAGLIGHGLMNWSIKQIPLWISSALTLLIPVVSTAAAWLWLGESLTAIQIGAMLVVVGALWQVVTYASRT